LEARETDDFYLALFELNFYERRMKLQKCVPFIKNQLLYVFDSMLVCYVDEKCMINVFDLDEKSEELVKLRRVIQVSENQQLATRDCYARMEGKEGGV
jgi:hypothetical protein